MLTLIALAEAGERQRMEGLNDNIMENGVDYPAKSLLSPYEMTPTAPLDEYEGGEWWNSLAEPSVQYYPPSYGSLESIPHYQKGKLKSMFV